MALISPINCNFNLHHHLINLSFKISPKSSLSFTSPSRCHPHSHNPLHGKHQLRTQCFKVTNELDEDSSKNDSQDDDDDDQGLGVKGALSMLRFYKREISPFLPKSCRYVPSCSEYSMIAYKKYGVAKGTILTAWRLCRCNPLGGSGFDPPRWFDEPKPSEE